MQQLAGFLVEVEGGVDDKKAPVVAAVRGHTDRGVVKAESPVDEFAWLGVSVLDQVRMQRIERAAMGDQGDVLLRASQYFIEHIEAIRAFVESEGKSVSASEEVAQ